MQSQVAKWVCKPEAVKNLLMKAHRDEHIKLCENLCRTAFPKISGSRKQIKQCNPGEKKKKRKEMV